MGICFDKKKVTNQNNTLIQNNIIIDPNLNKPCKESVDNITERTEERQIKINEENNYFKSDKISNEERPLNKNTIFQSDITIEIQNFSKKFVFQDIFHDYNDNIFDKIKIYEFNILKNIFKNSFEQNNINKNDYKKYSVLKLNKNELPLIIDNDDSKVILKDIIMDNIEKINQNEQSCKIKYLSILVIGRRGVGKTTLINYILSKNSGNKNTKIIKNSNNNNFTIYENKNFSYLRLIEFKGIGFGENNPEKIKEEAINYIKEQEQYNDYNNIVHCIWYCVSDARFEEDEITLLLKLKEVYNDNNIPIIVIYTKSIDVIMTKSVLDKIKGLNIGVSTMRLMAKPDKDNEGKKINPFGGEKLLALTIEKCTQALKGKLIYLMTNAISREIKTTINKENNNNKKIIFNKLVNNFMNNYNTLLNDDEFKNDLIEILNTNIFYLFHAMNDDKKKNKLKNIFNLLKGSNIFDSFEEYKNFYHVIIKGQIIGSINNKAKDFLINQAKVEKKFGNVNINNKRTLKEIQRSNDLFFEKNYNFILQLYLIKNFILDNNNKYYDLFQEIVEKRIGFLFETDEEIKNNLSHCFLIKLKQFSKDKNISLKLDITLNEEQKFPQDNDESYIENKNFQVEQKIILDEYNLPNASEVEFNLEYPQLKVSQLNNSEKYIFIPDINSEDDLRELNEENNLNKDLNLYLISNNDEYENLNNFMGMKEYENLFKYFSKELEDKIYNSLMMLIKKNLLNYFYSDIDNLIKKFLFYFNPKNNNDINQNNGQEINRNKRINQQAKYQILNNAAPTLLMNNMNNINNINKEFISGFNNIKKPLKNLILKEKKEIYFEEIKKKIDKMKSSGDYLIKYITIMIVGKSGVGKSTLINSIFKENLAKTGAPEIQTTETTIYRTTEINPFFQLIDTRGIELKKEFGPEKIIENTINYIIAQGEEEKDNHNNMIHCIWYCLTGATIEDKEIEIIKKLQRKFYGSIPLILVYTRMALKSNFETLKNLINQKLKDIIIIPILAENIIVSEDDEGGDNNVRKSFGLKNLKSKTIEIIKNTHGNIYNAMKKNCKNVLRKELIEKNNIFADETKNLIVQIFINNFHTIKNENEKMFLNFINKLLRINFRKNNLEKDELCQESKDLLDKIEIIFKDVKLCIEHYKEFVKKKIDSIREEKSMSFLDTQALLEKINQISILNNIKKDNQEFKIIINDFLKNIYYYISQKFIIYYSIVYKLIPFSQEINKLSNEVIYELVDYKEIMYIYNELCKKKIKDFENAYKASDLN